MRVPSELEWELIIVNNNCSDQTDDVIDAFAKRLPVRREFEPRRGHSVARNRAVDAARGDYIVWTDDDVVVDPDWLAAYADAFRRWPDAAVFGGRIIPKYDAPVAGWVIESESLLGAPYAMRDLGGVPVPLSLAEEDRLPFGANFALRITEQRAFRYNPELGLGAVRRRLGEEHDVIERIMRAGSIGYWVPDARVNHCISHERQTEDYIGRYFVGLGETLAYRSARPSEADAGLSSGPSWFGAPRWLWRRLLREWLRYHIHRRISVAPVWVEHLRNYALARGAIRYWRSERG